jgi:hypothetical protein
LKKKSSESEEPMPFAGADTISEFRKTGCEQDFLALPEPAVFVHR